MPSIWEFRSSSHLQRLDFEEPSGLNVSRIIHSFLGIICYGLTGSDRALQVQTDAFQCVVQATGTDP